MEYIICVPFAILIETHIFMPSQRFSSLTICFCRGEKGKTFSKQVGWGRFSVTWFQDLSFEMSHQRFTKLKDVPPFPAFFWCQKWPGFLKRQDGLVGRYPEDKAIYEERAPICHTDQLSCPILLLQGDEETWSICFCGARRNKVWDCWIQICFSR